MTNVLFTTTLALTETSFMGSEDVVVAASLWFEIPELYECVTDSHCCMSMTILPDISHTE